VFSHLAYFSKQSSGEFSELSWVGAGKPGVFLFFVLSAFLLFYRFCVRDDPADSRILGRYFERRILRIYPLYTFVLLGGVLASVFGYRWFYELSPREFLQNFLLLDGKGVFWTIPVEFKFYFLMPVLAMVFVYLCRKGYFAFLLVLSVLVGMVRLAYPLGGYEGESLSLPYYFSIFAGGCAAAIVFSWRKASWGSGWVLEGAGVISLLLLLVTVPGVLGFLTGEGRPDWRFVRSLDFYAVCCSVLVLATASSAKILGCLFASGPLVNAGKYSFSIYLLHMPVLKVTKSLLSPDSAAYWVLCVVGVYHVSKWTYLWIERPSFQIGDRLRRMARGGSV
jgi:peptidoglycan/LPS O-acetylase OafA/YrhL